MGENRDFKGVWIPKEIWLDRSLSALDKIILVEVDSLDNEDGCYASNQHFAEFCQCSESAVTKSISKLKSKGYIRQESFDGRKRVLRSCFSYTCKADLEDGTSQSSKIYDAESENMTGSLYIDNNINNNINNTSIKPSISSSNRTFQDEFEVLWKKYPKKQGKQKAMSAFIKARGKGIAYETISQGLDNYNEWLKATKKELKYTKNGDTWFGNHCWDDEYAVDGSQQQIKSSFMERLDMA